MRFMNGYYVDDVERIVSVCAGRMWLVTTAEAFDLWSERSASWDATWLFLPESDEELFEDIEKYLRDDDDETM